MSNDLPLSNKANQTVNFGPPVSSSVNKKPDELRFLARIVSYEFERFVTDPDAPVDEVFHEILKILTEGQPGTDVGDYRILIASPYSEEKKSVVIPSSTLSAKSVRLSQVVQNDGFIFFVKLTGKPTTLEIWIDDQKIEVVDKHELLIGRSDPLTGVFPDLDLLPYLGQNSLKISRKQALLAENEGRWTIRLHESAKSPIFLNDMEQLEHGKVYEVYDVARLGFGGMLNNSYVYMTMKIVRQ